MLSFVKIQYLRGWSLFHLLCRFAFELSDQGAENSMMVVLENSLKYLLRIVKVSRLPYFEISPTLSKKPPTLIWGSKQIFTVTVTLPSKKWVVKNFRSCFCRCDWCKLSRNKSSFSWSFLFVLKCFGCRWKASDVFFFMFLNGKVTLFLQFCVRAASCFVFLRSEVWAIICFERDEEASVKGCAFTTEYWSYKLC